ncbi:MAG: VWA domain-containing protein [Clostridia bacterium]|nr:VWA domain-containing protein [Clostridia bacterium]
MELTEKNKTDLNKWRLILGKNAERHIDFSGSYNGDISFENIENTLDYMYNMEYGTSIMRTGGQEGSQPYIADWINEVRKLFPKKTVEIIEKQALEHFGLTALLTDKEVLEKMEPNTDLLKTILQFKHLMQNDVIIEAKKIIKKVVDELTEKLKTEIRRSLIGKLNRNMPSNVKSIRNLDIKKTIRLNLKNYDKENERIVLKNLYFNSRIKRHSKWKIIIAVDESGSMLDSVIYSAVMAGIFAKLPMVDTKLVIFDTQIVDLSDHIENTVEVLMGMQLGGGTDIGNALSYCENLCSDPHKTIFVTVTDLYEGGSETQFLKTCADIIGSGSKMIFLTALDKEANPAYDKTLGKKLADMGAFVGAMTPEQLGDYIGKMIS